MHDVQSAILSIVTVFRIRRPDGDIWQLYDRQAFIAGSTDVYYCVRACAVFKIFYSITL